MFEVIFTSIIGCVFFVIGWRIWKKQQITLIHSYHYQRVSEQDKAAYTAQIGKGVIILGVGLILTGLINFIAVRPVGLICFGVGFVWGFAKILRAQRKYNGGLFS